MADITKIAPVIIKDGKFLIVRGKGQDFWKNVGGVLEDGETEIDCLKRETKEELDVDISEPVTKYYETPVTFTVTEPKRSLIIKLYRAEILGEPKPASEIEELHWISKKEFESGEYSIAYQINDYILPKLVKDGLVK